MMNGRMNIVEAVVVGGVSLITLFAGYAAMRTESTCRKLDMSVSDLDRKTHVDISDALVHEAVERAADREATILANYAAKEVKNDARAIIQNEVSKVVDEAKASCKVDVETELRNKIGKVDISDVKRDVVRAARDKAKQEFDADLNKIKTESKDEFESKLEDILHAYNRDLENTAKVYKSLASHLEKV